MKISDIVFKETRHGDSDILFTAHTEYGRITILDRMTGYGNGMRDIETGFTEGDGKFWLASGRFDIREYPELSVEEAIEKIKANANTCNPDRKD